MLEGYFLVRDFSDREKITFSLLKSTPKRMTSGKPIVSRGTTGNPHCFDPHPLEIISEASSRSSITLSGDMKISA